MLSNSEYFSAAGEGVMQLQRTPCSYEAEQIAIGLGFMSTVCRIRLQWTDDKAGSHKMPTVVILKVGSLCRHFVNNLDPQKHISPIAVSLLTTWFL